MSRFLKYTWLPNNTTAICKLQSIAAAGNLLINGVLASFGPVLTIGVPNAPIANLVASGSSRNITITSANNLAGVQFTVTGLQNNVPIVSAAVNGPNNATISIPNIFDIVTAIQVNGAANGVSVGIGSDGFFPLIKLNPDVNRERGGPFWALSISSKNTVQPGLGGMAFLVIQTLDEIANNGIPFKIQFNEDAPSIKIIEGMNLFPLTDPDPLINIDTIIGSQGGVANSKYALPYVNEILIAGVSTDNITTTMIFRQT